MHIINKIVPHKIGSLRRFPLRFNCVFLPRKCLFAFLWIFLSVPNNGFDGTAHASTVELFIARACRMHYFECRLLLCWAIRVQRCNFSHALNFLYVLREFCMWMKILSQSIRQFIRRSSHMRWVAQYIASAVLCELS